MIENKELKVGGKKKRWVWGELEREDEYGQNHVMGTFSKN